MKKKVKLLIYILLINTFLFSHVHQVSAQEKFNISTGIGLPELLNVGVRYQSNQTQIGLSIGSGLDSNDKSISITGDIYYHFGGFSELSNRRPWYGRFGLSYFQDENENLINIDDFFFLHTRLGRDFNISKKIGIAIDLGPIIILSSGKAFGLDRNLTGGISVSGGIGLFYRI